MEDECRGPRPTPGGTQNIDREAAESTTTGGEKEKNRKRQI